MTEVIDPGRVEPEAVPAGSLSDALDDVRRSAQQLLADVGSQPRALRIRAGDVLVELEWTDYGDGTPAGAGPDGAGPVAAGPALAALAAAPAAGDVPAGDGRSGLFALCAPTVGTFYRAPEPGAAPFVSAGDDVRPGQQVGIVEAMKLMIPLEAERDGRVAEILVADGTQVEYGDRLILFAPTAAG